MTPPDRIAMEIEQDALAAIGNTPPITVPFAK
jgi:hypothetical protein